MMALAENTRRMNGVRGKVIVRYMSEGMLKKVKRSKPIRFMVGGTILEIRSRNEKERKSIAFHKAEIKRLKGKIK